MHGLNLFFFVFWSACADIGNLSFDQIIANLKVLAEFEIYLLVVLRTKGITGPEQVIVFGNYRQLCQQRVM